jgi:hypothetical protein
MMLIAAHQESHLDSDPGQDRDKFGALDVIKRQHKDLPSSFPFTPSICHVSTICQVPLGARKPFWSLQSSERATRYTGNGTDNCRTAIVLLWKGNQGAVRLGFCPSLGVQARSPRGIHP